jgi:hypothetical protein
MIEDDRKDDPNAFTHFLRLYETLRGIERENEGKADAQSPEAITDYWEGETLSSVGTSVPRRRRLRRLSTGAAAGHTV